MSIIIALRDLNLALSNGTFYFQLILVNSNPRGISLLQKSVRDFFRTKGFLRISDGFFLQTKGFLPKAYEIFWSEMPLVQIFRQDRKSGNCDHRLYVYLDSVKREKLSKIFSLKHSITQSFIIAKDLGQ